MDIDDFEDDPIKKFLQHKLDEIRSSNVELQNQLTNKRKLLNENVQKTSSKFRGSDRLQVTDTWCNTFNGTWITGISLKSNDPERLITNIHPIFQWESTKPLTYTVKIFTQHKHPQTLPTTKKLALLAKSLETTTETETAENEWIQTDQISRHGIMIVCFEIPEFTHTNMYTLTGIVSYTCCSKKYHLKLQDFVLDVGDLLGETTEIKLSNLVRGDDKCYLSVLALNEKRCFAVKTSGNLERQLEFECRLFKVNVVSSTEVFLFDCNANGSVIKIQKGATYMTYTLIVYTRNNFSLQLLLHHLHRHIPDILILPIEYKSQITEITSANLKQQESVKQFAISLDTQIEFADNFFMRRLRAIPDEAKQEDSIDLNIDIADYKEFRMRLSNLEAKSELLCDEVAKTALL